MVFNKFLQQFLTVDNDLSDRERSEINPVVYLNVPYIAIEFRRFVSRLANLFSRLKFCENLPNSQKSRGPTQSSRSQAVYVV